MIGRADIVSALWDCAVLNAELGDRSLLVGMLQKREKYGPPPVEVCKKIAEFLNGRSKWPLRRGRKKSQVSGNEKRIKEEYSALMRYRKKLSPAERKKFPNRGKIIDALCTRYGVKEDTLLKALNKKTGKN